VKNRVTYLQNARFSKHIFIVAPGLTVKSRLHVIDSTWKASEAFELDRNKNVDAWAKNDHLGFEVFPG
jgi:hypothetical protein